MRCITTLLLCALVTACAVPVPDQEKTSPAYSDSSTEAKRILLLGKWCGSKTLSDGSVQQWLANRAADGRYRIDFMTSAADGSRKTWGEYGLWGVRGPVYFTAVRGFIENGRSDLADTNDATLYDAYTILRLTDQEFSYRSFASGNVFTVTRACASTPATVPSGSTEANHDSQPDYLY